MDPAIRRLWGLYLRSPSCVVKVLRSGVKLRPTQLRAELHLSVLELRREGLSYNQIITEVEKLFRVKLWKSHISGWVTGSHRPYGSVRVLNTNPNAELGYVIGVMMGDATMSVSHFNYMIKLRVSDKEFAQEFARCLSVILRRTAPRVRWHEKTRLWQTELSSLFLWQFLHQRLSKLAETIQHCDVCKGAFLRGFFDSEGSIRKRDLDISNGNLQSIQYVRTLLISLGIQSTPPRLSQKGGRTVIIKGKSYRQNKDIY